MILIEKGLVLCLRHCSKKVFSVSKQPEGMSIIIFKYTLASMNINI